MAARRLVLAGSLRGAGRGSSTPAASGDLGQPTQELQLAARDTEPQTGSEHQHPHSQKRLHAGLGARVRHRLGPWTDGGGHRRGSRSQRWRLLYGASAARRRRMEGLSEGLGRRGARWGAGRSGHCRRRRGGRRRSSGRCRGGGRWARGPTVGLGHGRGPAGVSGGPSHRGCLDDPGRRRDRHQRSRHNASSSAPGPA